MATRTYKRSVRIMFGPAFFVQHLEGEGLRIQFDVTRDSRSNPDMATVRITNLADSTRKLLQGMFDELSNARKVIINTPLIPDAARAASLFALEESFKFRIFAGYGLNPTQIFQGNLVEFERETKANGTDYVTTFKAGDGLTAYRDGYISEAFAPGVTMETFRKTVQLAMGLAESPDATAVVSAVAPQAVITQAANGLVAVGKASKALDKLAEMYGLQWWVRDGLIYYVPQGSVTLDFSILLIEGQDLISVPTPKSNDDVSGKALLNGDLHPGRGMFVVKLPRPTDLILNPMTGLRGEHVGSANGLRCEKVHHFGDTHSNPYYTEFEARTATTAIAAPVLEFTEAEVTALALG